MFKKFLLISILFPCLVNAQSLLSRVWHNSVSHYNYYYNANVIVTDAKLEASNSYKDNFKNILNLYPYPDEGSLKGNAAKMDEAIKKCSYIIDKHSKSKWVDDAYLLMGDARFFKGDFYSAIEVYEYVISNFKNSPAAHQAEINLLITYLQLGKNEDAEALYTKLKTNKTFSKHLLYQLDIAGAAVNIRQEKYLIAIKLLENALPHFKNKASKIRYNFVLAQLYIITKNNYQGVEKYKKVIKINPPYEFAFNAKLNIVKAINVKNKGEIRNAKLLLQGMLKDDKNIDYFDVIYYELGQLELLDKNESKAISEFRNALSSKTSDIGIKSLTYLALADLYFKSQDYENAQVYYDSAARTVEVTNPNYQSIQNKNLVLSDLIKHLVNIKEKDSLLRLADNEKLREKTIDKLIKEEKDKELEAKRIEEIQKTNQDAFAQNTQNVTTTNFPFYNQTAKTKGLQDFQKIWGTRKLMDFWAISSNKTAVWKEVNDAQENNDYGNDEKTKVMGKVSDERKKYYEAIPFSKADKDKMKSEIAESYVLGANVYYQNLKEYDKAQKMLLELNTKYPKNNYELNSWYLLAKIAQTKNDIPQFNYYYNLIKSSDSTSNFLIALKNSEGSDSIVNQSSKSNVSEEVENQYRAFYSLYKDKKYDEALSLKSQNDKSNPGSPLQIQYDFVEALCYAQKGDMATFEQKITAIINNYPNTEIAQRCEEMVYKLKVKRGEIVETNSVSTKYTLNESADHFYILLIPKAVDFTKVKIAFLNRNKVLYTNDGLRVTNSLLGDKFQILIVNNFKSLDDAKRYIKEVANDPKFQEELNLGLFFKQFIIGKDNFSIFVTDKVIEDYESFYNTNYNK